MAELQGDGGLAGVLAGPFVTGDRRGETRNPIPPPCASFSEAGEGVMGDLWLTIEADRALYADRGREVILCDRLASPVTLVVRVNENSVAALRRQLAAPSPTDHAVNA